MTDTYAPRFLATLWRRIGHIVAILTSESTAVLLAHCRFSFVARTRLVTIGPTRAERSRSTVVGPAGRFCAGRRQRGGGHCHHSQPHDQTESPRQAVILEAVGLADDVEEDLIGAGADAVQAQVA